MTDYGPGHGNTWQPPEPWHDDPLGDTGYGGQQQYPQTGWQDATAQGYPQAGYQDPGPQQGYQDASGGWQTGGGQRWNGQDHGWQIQAQQPQQGWDTGQFAAGYDHGYGTDAYGHGAWGVDPYAAHDPLADPYPDPYAGGPGARTWQQDPYAPPQDATGQYAVPQQQQDSTGQYAVPQQQQDSTGQYAVPQQQQDGTGQFAVPQQQQDGTGQFAVPQQQGTGAYGYPQDTTGQFAAAGAAAPVREQTARIPAQAPAPEPPAAPDDEDDWDPFGDEGEETHPFFTGETAALSTTRRSRTLSDDEDDDEDDLPARRAPGQGKKEKKGKRRNGCACLAVAVVLVGAVGGGGYAAWTYYQNHIAPPPDWAGHGTGSVQVTVPDASTLAVIGNILKKEGVVESVDAFTRAAADNPHSAGIQGGVYTLHRHMSAAAAVTMMLDPASQSTLIVTEGMRAAAVYSLIDSRLHLKAGTTRSVARAQYKKLGLPSWADDSSHIKDPLEGFLFPTRYSVARGEKPEQLLRQMVAQATHAYADLDVSAQAKAHGLKDPLQFVTVASLVQAEGKTDADFRKMAKVVYNRLDPNNPETYGSLQFDSTYNYIKNASETNLDLKAMKALDDPYNTYHVKGLPPGPIGNPGLDALRAVEHPDSGDWYYFISLDGKATRFTRTFAEFQVLYRQYNAQHH